MSNEDLIQGSEAWFSARLGVITASRLADIMKKTKYNESTYKTRLRFQLAIERVSGKSASDTVMNKAMHDGVEREPDARNLFEAISASPDGIIRGENAVLELKCPTHITHAKNLLSDTMPSNYIYQVQWQIACTESDYAYFASYHPDYPKELRLKWMRVERDDKVIKSLEEAVRQFDIEIEDLIIKLKKGATTDG